MAEQPAPRVQRPLVLPDVYTGEGSFVDWAKHFGNVAAVNQWDDDQKLLWLKVRLGGKAQTAFGKLPAESQAAYEAAIAALKERFEPASLRQLYIAKFQARKKAKTEGWADYADDLRVLADKAYPELDQNARQLVTLQHYLNQVDNMQLSFAIRQRTPHTIDEAVRATLELESYLRPKPVSVQTTLDPTEALKRVEAREDVVLKALSDITTRLEKLETASTTRGSQDKFHAPGRGPPPKSRVPTPEKEVICLRCGRVGHYARGCATKRPIDKPGNGKPPA